MGAPGTELEFRDRLLWVGAGQTKIPLPTTAIGHQRTIDQFTMQDLAT
jgi:hypothetical protein